MVVGEESEGEEQDLTSNRSLRFKSQVGTDCQCDSESKGGEEIEKEDGSIQCTSSACSIAMCLHPDAGLDSNSDLK